MRIEIDITIPSNMTMSEARDELSQRRAAFVNGVKDILKEVEGRIRMLEEMTTKESHHSVRKTEAKKVRRGRRGRKKTLKTIILTCLYSTHRPVHLDVICDAVEKEKGIVNRNSVRVALDRLKNDVPPLVRCVPESGYWQAIRYKKKKKVKTKAT